MESSRKISEQDFEKEWVLHGPKDLACLFDWSNYSVDKMDDAGEVVTYHPPEERRRKAEAGRQSR